MLSFVPQGSRRKLARGRVPSLRSIFQVFVVALAACPLLNIATIAAAAPPPPLSVTSYYLSTTNPDTLFNLGCSLGERDLRLPGTQDDLAILAFGRPAESNGSYGTILFDNSFADLGEVSTAVRQFAHGYYRCTGNDLASHARVAVGTSNYGPEVTAGHGRAWAQMVNRLNRQMAADGFSRQVDVAGASDMEPDWNSPAVTRAWVDGYASAYRAPLYNFGAASGCPPFGSCGAGAHPEWTQEDIWYISWGAAPAWPVPEIYLTDGGNAQQWYELSLYSFLNHGRRMDFQGVLTQSQACAQVGCDPAVANTPEQGWSQLWDILNDDPRTAQPVRWSTDIAWN